MEAPIHAADEVDKDETGPRIIAVVAGVVLIAIAAGALVYSGIWSPPATQAVAHTQTQH
jgi:hypothetical protein